MTSKVRGKLLRWDYLTRPKKSSWATNYNNAGQKRIYTFLAVCESHVMFDRRWTRTSLSTTSRSCSAATGASSAIRHSDMFSGSQAWQIFHQKFDPKISTTWVIHSHQRSWRLEALPQLFALIDLSQFYCHTDNWQYYLTTLTLHTYQVERGTASEWGWAHFGDFWR